LRKIRVKRLLPVLLAATALAAPARAADTFWFGADLSYVNEMEDCGAKYRDRGAVDDPFHIFKAHGTNLVRVRLWIDPTWTKYSNVADVEKTIKRAHAQGMSVLLDFHYSDTWADGDKQPAPKVWADIKDPKVLADAVYKYTVDTLTTLAHDGLVPEMVQVGNETNVEMIGGKKGEPIDWTRNALILNAGIKGVRDAGAGWKTPPKVMLHIAQPENAEPWFEAATQAGVKDYDIIGLSYYAKWSKETIAGLAATINRLHRRYGAEVMVAETAYPWTMDWADSMPNLLGQDTLMKDYPATPDGQTRYLVDLTQAVIGAGGDGVIYWEPAWVSTNCRTQWGQGSGWENATFFDFHKGDDLLPAADYTKHAYVQPVETTFRFDVTGAQPEHLYLWGDFLGARDMIIPLNPDGSGHWTYKTRLMPGTAVRYQVYDRLPVGPGLLPGVTADAKVGQGATVIEQHVERK
jgi:arabinogalactan endo-1,4-beta-galactosidase